MKVGIIKAGFALSCLCLLLVGCSHEDPVKNQVQASIGVNKAITGSYDEDKAAICHNGTFVGESDGDVLSFKGIPYAIPPVGDLRWKNPVLAKEGDGVYEAKYFGKSPIQTEAASEPGSYYLQGEDCLTLNVWTNTSGPSSGKTVMVFFHGGSYAWGATSDPMYDGHNLVAKYPDLVLVTVGYRTGIMGFIDFSEVPGGEDYASSSSLGLLDQICALQWVQKNISSFGGDPGNVTIFGESAGGGSVSLIPLIDGTKGLFRRVIAQSGSPCLTFSREECRYLTRMLLDASGCSTMDELMALSEDELMELNYDLDESYNFPERDGIILPLDLYGAWEDASLADIDLMVGTNRDEFRYFRAEMDEVAPLLPKGFVYDNIIIPVRYENNLRVMNEEERALTDDFMALQSGRRIWKITEFYNEVLFRIPALEQAIRHKGKSYNYYWTMPGADKTLGACHAIELAYVFNNSQDTIYTGGLYNEKLGSVVQDMWVNFARCGDPSTGEYSWEPYNADTRQTMVLGEQIGMTEDLKREQRELTEPLLHLYITGRFSNLDYNVPQSYKLAALAVITMLLIAAAVYTVIKRLVQVSKGVKRDGSF